MQLSAKSIGNEPYEPFVCPELRGERWPHFLGHLTQRASIHRCSVDLRNPLGIQIPHSRVQSPDPCFGDPTENMSGRATLLRLLPFPLV